MSNQKKNVALNMKEKLSNKTTLSSSPVRVSMNMTGKCNIRCIYCHLTFADYYTKNELDLNQFKKLEPFLENLSHLVYFSSTEPLMAKHFNEIFEYSTNFNNEKYISTNGIILDKKKAELIVKGGLKYLTISFAGFTKESFIHAHQVDGLDKVTENIDYLNKLKEKYNQNNPKLRIVFVTWKENAHELPLAVEYAHKHKCAEGLKITFLKAYDDNMIDSIPYDHKEYVNKYVREAQELGKKLNVKVDFDGGEMDESITADDMKNAETHRKCYEPWERFHIEADGKVRTCPIPTNTIIAGDLNKQSVEEIWNGDVYKMFREKTNSDDPPDPCKRCTHNQHKNFGRRDIWDQRDLDLGIYERLKDRNYLKANRKGSKKVGFNTKD